MEGVSVSAYKRLKSYLYKKRRGYQRLTGPSEPAHPGPKRRWRVRRIRVFRRATWSPRRWLRRVRDAYVGLMLRLGSSSLVTTGFGGPIDCYGPGFGPGPMKEYDEKVIAQIHKTLVMAQRAQGGIVPRVAPDSGPTPSHALSAR